MGLNMSLYSYEKGTDKNAPFALREEYYWRKANAIHKWFVDTVQAGVDNCGKYDVSKEDLKDLVLIINQILNEPDEKKKIKLAKELLPTCPGFFFGSYEYDDWYFDTLKDTYVALGNLLNQFDFENNNLLYWSSW